MEIYLLYTCDTWKSIDSMVLRGVFTDDEQIEHCMESLKENGVIDNIENEIYITSVEENTCYIDGGYIR